MADKLLTAGEECQVAAKILSSFADPRQGAITSAFISSAMGVAVFRGSNGVAVVRLRTGGKLLFIKIPKRRREDSN